MRAATPLWPPTVFATRPQSVGVWEAPPVVPAPAASGSAARWCRGVAGGRRPTTPTSPVTGPPPPAVSPSVEPARRSASSGEDGGEVLAR